MGSTKFEVEKFTGKNDFSLWRLKMRAFLVQQGVEDALAGEPKLPDTMSAKEKKAMLNKAHSALILSLGDKVLREVSKENSAAAIWLKLENLDDFNKVILDLEYIEIKIDDEDQALVLLKSLPSEYDNLTDKLIYGRESVTLEVVQNALCAKELSRKSEIKEENAEEVLNIRGRTQKRESKGKKGKKGQG